MIDLIQIPWSPYCLVQRRILEFSGARFKIVNVSSADRSPIWRLSKGRYYQVPVVRDGKSVLFEVAEDSQVIAKYLDTKFQLGLFPQEWEGVQNILWRYIEGEVEGVGFKLNDIYWKEFVPARDQMGFLRHKERKFGRGCLEQWDGQQEALKEELTVRLLPFEEMLLHRPFLLGEQPRFVDFDLLGILGNYLFSGHHQLPSEHSQLKAWHRRMSSIQVPPSAREKLHS